MKPLPAHLRYAFLRPNSTLPAIISSGLLAVQVEQLIQVLQECKTAIGWTMANINGISPTFCMYKILLEEGHKPSRERQQRLNPNIKEVVKKEVIKWLDASIIFPISDNNRWCMLAIFKDMVEDIMEVFMDDFSVVGDSFKECLHNLRRVLRRCVETNLVLNWEKFHFIVQEGIVLRHRVSSKGIEVDHAKVDVIEKLPLPTSVKVVRSFLGHAKFYRLVFEELKKRLVTTPIIVAPNWKQLFELMCDASDYAIGAILGQRKDKLMHPIYYASRMLSGAQLNYTMTEKEILTVVFAFNKIRKGTENQVADHLSRLEGAEKKVEVEDIIEIFPNEQLLAVTMEETPWYADIANYLAIDNMIWRCIPRKIYLLFCRLAMLHHMVDTLEGFRQQLREKESGAPFEEVVDIAREIKSVCRQERDERDAKRFWGSGSFSGVP
ncbi:uncharacterized protein [Nicotiana sylvestris]|uniref:uncharacterized protein n=1 Tax=Nicotiana sylvestris TaxID=4096 RepID=UPI00388CDE42